MSEALESYDFLYPQVPIEDERDVDLLWSEELEYMSLLKKKYYETFDDFNSKWERKPKFVNDGLKKVCNDLGINFRRTLDTYKFQNELNGETVFYEYHPEWFGYMVLGREFLSRNSKARRFSFFLPFQVDYQRSFMNPYIYRMGVIANRGGAKSWLNTYCSDVDCSIHPGMEISILGGSEKQSKGAYDYAYEMALDETCGIHHLIDKKQTTKDVITFKPRRIDGTVASDGIISRIFNQAASEKSVRGPRASKIVLDEVTRIPTDIIESVIGQAITSPSIKLVWGGTPDDPGHIAHTDWWCNPPDNVTLLNGKKVKCHHWIKYETIDHEDPKKSLELSNALSWHLFQWDAYDCHVEKGGWITEYAIQMLKTTYKTFSKRRREIYGKWTSSEGNILKMEDIEYATDDFDARNLPKDLSSYDGFIVSVDGARHRHYSTIVVVGFKNFMAYVIYARGWNHIKEPKFRGHIMKAVSRLKDRGARNMYVILEDAPVSSALIDNVREECKNLHIRFFTSTFK